MLRTQKHINSGVHMQLAFFFLVFPSCNLCSHLGYHTFILIYYVFNTDAFKGFFSIVNAKFRCYYPNLLGLNDFVVLCMFLKKQTVGKAYVKGPANK
jgi:hypothetical protein